MSDPSNCVLEPVLKAVTRRWSASLLWLLCENGPMRSGTLMRAVEGASVKVLTQRLRDLEAQGLVQRRQIGTAPSEVTYAVTPRGLELRATLAAMLELAQRWSREDARVWSTRQPLAAPERMSPRSVCDAPAGRSLSRAFPDQQDPAGRD